MPTVVRKGGSYFILGTYVTSLALGVTYFLGGELLASHDNRKEMIHMQKSVDLVNDTMSSFITYSNENRLGIERLDVEISHCKVDIQECKGRFK